MELHSEFMSFAILKYELDDLHGFSSFDLVTHVTWTKGDPFDLHG